MVETNDPAQVLSRSDAGSGRLPLWSQVKSLIIAMIRDNRLAENARLPSEHEMCQRFGVSRTVVREAMNQLVYERIIYKIQGKGAFVAGRRDEQNFVGSTVGFSGELIGRQKLVTRRVLLQRIGVPSERVRRVLNLSEGDGPNARIIEISRVLIVDGIPRILVNTSIPEKLAPGLDQAPLNNRSLYDTLQRRYGFVFRRADRWLEAVTPTAEQAALLDVGTGTPLLAIESCSYSEIGEPSEH
jgi:GntR family transcriptional regulator